MKNIILIFPVLLLFSCSFIKPVKLSIYSYRPETTPSLNKAIELFRKSNKNVNISIEEVRNDAFSILEARFKDGTAPDILMLPAYKNIYQMVEKNRLIDLSGEKFVNNIPENLKRGISYYDRIYGFPLNLNAYFVIYNKDIFDKYNIGIPRNVELLKEICKTLKDNGVTPFTSDIKDYWRLGYLFAMGYSNILGDKNKMWMDSMNSGVGSFKISGSNNFTKTLDIYKNNINRTGSKTSDFTDGITAMSINSIQVYSSLKKNPNGRYGAFPLPFTDNVEDAKLFADVEYAFTLNSILKGKRLKTALNFINFLSDPECQKIFINDRKTISPFNNINMDNIDKDAKELQKYIIENKLTDWVQNEWPKAVFEKSKELTRDYIVDKKNYNNIIEELDNIWSLSIQKSK